MQWAGLLGAEQGGVCRTAYGNEGASICTQVKPQESCALLLLFAPRGGHSTGYKGVTALLCSACCWYYLSSLHFTLISSAGGVIDRGDGLVAGPECQVSMLCAAGRAPVSLKPSTINPKLGQGSSESTGDENTHWLRFKGLWCVVWRCCDNVGVVVFSCVDPTGPLPMRHGSIFQRSFMSTMRGKILAMEHLWWSDSMRRSKHLIRKC